jgi:hypothetical protein
VCSSVCCVSFNRGVILCDVCYLCVVSYCKPLPPGKTPSAVKIILIKSAKSKQRKKYSFVKDKRMLTVIQNVGSGSVHLFTLNVTIFKFVSSICHRSPPDITVDVIWI